MINWLLALTAAFRLVGYFTEPRLEDSDIHAVVGDRDAIRAPAAAGALPVNPPNGGHPMKIVTWNIERGVAFERIAALLADLDADIVLLQEVDRGCRRSGYRDVARDLAARLGLNWVAAGEFQEIGEGRRGHGCVTGQAILSRATIADASVIRFAEQASAKWRFNPIQPRRGGRIALVAAINGVVAVSVHLESGDGDERTRAKQVEEMAAVIDADRDRPAIVAGDFNNAAGIESAMFAPLTTSGFQPTRHDRSTARRPIDWIFARGLSGASSVVLAEEASDHDPVVAVVAEKAVPGKPGGQ